MLDANQQVSALGSLQTCEPFEYQDGETSVTVEPRENEKFTITETYSVTGISAVEVVLRKYN